MAEPTATTHATTQTAPLRPPVPPAELWGLWWPTGGRERTGSWWKHSHVPYNGPMTFTSREDAERAAEYESWHFRELRELVPVLIGVAPHAEVAT